MPFNPGMRNIRLAKSATASHDEVQKALDEFQVAIASAVVTLGNIGVDPAVIGDILSNVGEGVTHEGYAVVIEAFNDPRGQEYLSRIPPVVEEFARLGGNPPRRNPAGFGDDILAELGLRPRSPLEIN